MYDDYDDDDDGGYVDGDGDDDDDDLYDIDDIQATQFRMGTMSKMGVNVLKTGKVNCFDAIDMMEILSILAAYEFLNIEAALNMAIKENNDDGESIVMLAKCQYKDIPVWSVSVGLPKDLVTYLLKIRYNKLQ